MNYSEFVAYLSCDTGNNRNVKSSAEVGRIARLCREWAEHVTKNSEHYTRSLCGFCAIAAGKVFTELLKANYAPVIHLWEGRKCTHCFIQVDDYVVDITATQFEEFRDKKVLILHEKEAIEYRYYSTSKTFDSIKALREHQISTGWPTEQICYNF